MLLLIVFSPALGFQAGLIGLKMASESDRIRVSRASNQVSSEPMEFSVFRREILQTILLTGLSASLSGECAAKPLDSVLNDRLLASTIRKPDLAGPMGATEAQYPDWLFGEWVATYSYTGSSFPLGRSFAEFKQLLAGSIRAPADAKGAETRVSLRWIRKELGKPVSEDRPYNTKNYYNAFSKPITVEGVKGSRTRNVAWMPILTQRGIYEKVNQVEWQGENNVKIVVKEIAPDLSVVGATPLEGSVVSRSWSRLENDTFVISELFRLKRLSQGRVKMIETGTGDTELVTKYEIQQDGAITGQHRVLVYLVPFAGPAGDLYADSEGRAVAIYDWTFRMTSVTPVAS